MFPEQYHYVGILFFVLFLGSGLIAYLFLLQEPELSKLGITVTQNGYIYPTYNFFIIKGILRTVIGWISVLSSICFGLGSIYFISWYLDYKKRS